MCAAVQTSSNNMNYEYMNRELIRQDLFCLICQNPFIEPMLTQCKPRSHTFCRECIEGWIEFNPICVSPCCHERICREDLIPANVSYFIKDLGDLRVKCLGCLQSGFKRADFDAHYDQTCPKTNIACQWFDVGCSWRGPRNEFEEHSKNCIFGFVWEYLCNGFDLCMKQQKDLLIKVLQAKTSRQDSTTNSLEANQQINGEENGRKIELPADMEAQLKLMQQIFHQILADKLNQYQIQFDLTTKDRNQKQAENMALQTENTSLRNQLQQMKMSARNNAQGKYI